MAESWIELEVEDETLEGARAKVRSQTPQGLRLLSETILSDGKRKTVRGSGETSDAAFSKAQEAVPAAATILEKKEVSRPAQRVVRVEAFDDTGASAAVRLKNADAVIKSMTVAVRGAAGFLGMGKRPHQYDAEIFEPAVVEIVYRTKAKVSAQIGRGMILTCRRCSTVYKVGHDAMASPMAVINRQMGNPPGPLDDAFDVVFHFKMSRDASPELWDACDRFVAMRVAEIESRRASGGIDIKWICQTCLGKGAGSAAANPYP